ncbi:TetR/AcrR family transcriptional regulator [Pseudonocardia acaciae]|uniref:TetR/AcrR family transcriptional regulator n=1 Tax=Pseudonocardia acaciae TaxID=551276 RepID=UPI000490BDC0|nr:TetR family transcriptional regulator [Pseudonocardia acaciae]
MAFTQRSERSRAAILASARQLLTAKGYEGTTIRAVAAEAGIDPSMVMRYYGSKEGLFAAAVDIDLMLPADAANWPRERLGEGLARHFVSRWEGDLSDELITMLLRSASTNPAAAERLRTVFASQVLEFVGMVAPDAVPRRAGMIGSQVLGLALCRYVLELPPVVAMDGDTLARTLAPVLQHYLTGDLGAPVAG